MFVIPRLGNGTERCRRTVRRTACAFNAPPSPPRNPDSALKARSDEHAPSFRGSTPAVIPRLDRGISPQGDSALKARSDEHAPSFRGPTPAVIPRLDRGISPQGDSALKA
ncbi:MAG: hypothetical protein LBR16_02790 [Treponema sp.]|nr:hypothetical protein [Treponema sp.]